MLLLDARRLTGPNLYSPRPAVLVELSLAEGEAPEVVAAAYFEELARMAAAAGLPPADRRDLPIVRFRGGAAVLFAGPVDTLLAAAEAAEWAAESAAERLAGPPARPPPPQVHDVRTAAAAPDLPALPALA